MGILDRAFSYVARALKAPALGIYTSDMWRVPPLKRSEDYLRLYGEVGWLFAVVSKISESVGQSQWKVVQVAADGSREEVLPSHPAVQLLKMVNPFWTSYDLFQLHQLYMDLAGESFWYIIRDGARRPRSIWLLPPHRMDVIPSDNIQEHVSGYALRTAHGPEPIPLSTDEIVHFKRPNPLNVYRGMSPVGAAIYDVDSELFAGQYIRNFYFNNATPGGFLKMAHPYSKEEHEQLIEAFEKRHQGVGAAGRIGVLWGGMEYQATEVSAKELRLIEMRKLTCDNILGIYSVPRSVMGITEDVNRANAEAGYHGYATQVIVPRLALIASTITERFLPMFGPGLALEFVDVVPEDEAFKLQRAVSGYTMGVLTLNEARKTLGEDEVEGGDFVIDPALAQASKVAALDQNVTTMPAAMLPVRKKKKRPKLVDMPFIEVESPDEITNEEHSARGGEST